MLCLNDYEKYAEKHIDHKTWAFYSQGAEREVTLKENLQSFTRYTLMPRMLLNTCQRDLSTTILGHKVSFPVGLAPSAYQKLAHPDGEIGASKASEEVGTVYTLSTVSNSSLEDVAKSVPNRSSPLWMQLYLCKNRQLSENIIRRIDASGYKAIVLTVDTPVTGLQFKMWRTGGCLVPPHLSIPNVSSVVKTLRDSGTIPSHIDFVKDVFKEDISWDDVAWIKRITKLPLILKGVLTAEDAKKAVEYGAAAVWISNHGGRQLDCVHAAIDVLPEIAEALSGSGCEIYIDGGVRWGSDVLKALALGARAVFIGRPVLWGLAHSGQSGVRSVLEILKSELDRAMHLSGCNTIADIGPHLIKRHHLAKF